MSSGSGSVVAGYRYLLGIFMGMSRGPVDEIIQIKVGDRTAWYGSLTDNGTIDINAPELFGGDNGEGGIVGPAQVMFGAPTQVAPPELVAMCGEALPGYRRMFTMFFDGMVSAMNPYPKTWKMRMRRSQKGWDGATWFPETATIDLTRVTTPGETTDSNGTGGAHVDSVKGNAQVYGNYNADANLRIYMNPVSDTGDPRMKAAIITRVLSASYQDSVGADSTDIPIPSGVNGWTYTPGTNYVTFAASAAPTGFVTLFYEFEIIYTSGDPSTESISLIRAMNGAHIIYEALTNREWGRGLTRDTIDDASFRAAANTLFKEKFGLCIKWSRSDSVESFVQSVLDHIGAVLYEDRTTALLRLDLIRGDYDANTLPVFDSTSGLVELKQAAVVAPASLINEVQVSYHDPVTDKDAFVKAQNTAMKQISGGSVNVLKKNYPGIPLSSLAGRIAQRDLRANGIGLRRFTLIFDRRGAGITPGSVIKIRDLSRNIRDVVVRIGRFEDGTIEDGRIKCTGIQDAFGFPSSTFTGTEPLAWQPPNRRPCIGRRKVFEVPYITLYRRMTTADFATVQQTDAYLGTLMEPGQPLNAAYGVAVKLSPPDHATEDPPDASYVCAL